MKSITGRYPLVSYYVLACIGEELGWRGFRCYNVYRTSS
jgi:hypothetical protein